MTKKQPPLKEQAIELLRKHRGHWPTIARETGLGYQWIIKLAADKIPDPGVVKIEKLLAWRDGTKVA